MIGVPAFHFAPNGTRTRVGLFESYLHAVEAGSGAPVMIPLNLETDSLRAIYATLDGLFLAGGDDINPAYYHQAPHPKTKSHDPQRDSVEILLTQWALADRLPLFGVCRGVQTLNVAAGGTLIQDIHSLMPRSLRHDYDSKQPRHLATHPVYTAAGSRVAGVLGAQANVNSFHHQAVGEVAAGFRITAHAPDGIVEAIEREGDVFCVGVQWHPEDMVEHDEKMRGLFRAFVSAI